jgi:hypothetical protein
MTSQNSVVTPVSKLFDKPTTADGGFKARLWTTNARIAMLNNSIAIDRIEPAVNYEFSTPKGVYIVGSDVLAGRALYESLAATNGAELDDLLQLMSEGYLINAQKQAELAVKNSQGSSKKTSLSPVAAVERVLTSGEYLANCVKLSEPDLMTFYSQTHNLDNLKKETLIGIINGLRQQIVNENQLQHYKGIILVEEQEAAKYAALTDIGFINISRLTTGLINCQISMIDFANNALTKMVQAGFQLKGDIRPIEGNLFALTLVEGQPNI